MRRIKVHRILGNGLPITCLSICDDIVIVCVTKGANVLNTDYRINEIALILGENVDKCGNIAFGQILVVDISKSYFILKDKKKV
jgi:hypothetical protein